MIARIVLDCDHGDLGVMKRASRSERLHARTAIKQADRAEFIKKRRNQSLDDWNAEIPEDMPLKL
jgi:hypothetical protein